MANKVFFNALSATLVAIFLSFSTAYAGVRGDVKGESMFLSAGDQLQGLVAQEIANNPTYAPIQTQLPKPTHYYAQTLSCTSGNGDYACQPYTCQYNGTTGNRYQLLSKPIDAETPPPTGIGTIIDQDNAVALRQWDRGGFFCDAILPTAKGAVLSEALDFQTEDLQEHGLVGSKVNGSKNNGLTLIKYNTNIWAEPQEQTINTTILDVPVQARAVPKEYVFDYGDGTPLQTRSVPGHFLQDDEWDEKTATTHVYEETGTFQANVMTVYEAEMSVNGGEWLPMTGQAEVWGNPVPVDVWRTDTYLVNPDKINR